ncbi:MAG: DoxX protein [Gemmatimonadales bacterium]
MALHERWFLDDSKFPVQFGTWSSPHSLIPIAVAVGITLVATIIFRARGRHSVIPGPIAFGMPWENYVRLLTWVPLVIGVHTGVTLLVSGVNRELFIPNLVLPVNLLGGVLGMIEIAIALAFIYGALARPAAAALGLTWIIGAVVFGPWRLLEHTEILGIAFFLYATGRGPLAFDMALEKLHRPVRALIPYAVPVLRVSLGIGLVLVALSEKIWNIPMGLAFLAEHNFNFFPYIGMPGIDDTKFVLIAGAVELIVGMMLIAGTYVRLVIIVTLIPFNLTLPFLGWQELVGHLPTYGILALLLLWGDERPGERGALVRALLGARA